MGCLRRQGRAKLRLLTIIVPIAICVIVGPCWGVCATLPIVLCQEPVGCGGDLEICLLLLMGWQRAWFQGSFLSTWGGILIIRGRPCSHLIVIGGLVVIEERLSGLSLGFLILWPMKSWWLLLWRSLGPVRVLFLRSLPPSSLTLQLLLFTGFVGSLHPWDNDKLLDVTLKHFFIQDTGTEDNHSMGVQQRTSTSGERPGDSLLAVNYEGDRLALHSHCHTVPLAIC